MASIFPGLAENKPREHATVEERGNFDAYNIPRDVINSARLYTPVATYEDRKHVRIRVGPRAITETLWRGVQTNREIAHGAPSIRPVALRGVKTFQALLAGRLDHGVGVSRQRARGPQTNLGRATGRSANRAGGSQTTRTG